MFPGSKGESLFGGPNPPAAVEEGGEGWVARPAYGEDGLALAEGLSSFIVKGSRNGTSVRRPPAN